MPLARDHMKKVILFLLSSLGVPVVFIKKELEKESKING